jgi:hypothetical protein
MANVFKYAADELEAIMYPPWIIMLEGKDVPEDSTKIPAYGGVSAGDPDDAAVFVEYIDSITLIVLASVIVNEGLFIPEKARIVIFTDAAERPAYPEIINSNAVRIVFMFILI